MNSPLSALMTKLAWQSDELQAHLYTVEEESMKIKQHVQEIEQKVSQSSIRYSAEINPEVEIARLHFMAQLHHQKDELTKTLQHQEELATQLNNKLLRIKTEHRMLEKHLANKQANLHKEQEKAQAQSLDEWVIQRRKIDESR